MSPPGLRCLEHSISKWIEVYGDYAERYICVNGVCTSRFCHLDATCIDQTQHVDTLPWEPHDTFWKFCPPRLRKESHEVIIDNDLVIYGRSPALEDFWTGDHVIATAAHRACYGQFETLLKPGWLVNTGLVGFPPGFDFGSMLHKMARIYPFLKLSNHCDDQGAFIYLTKDLLRIIPLEEITVCNPTVDYAPYRLGISGTHFAALNSGRDVYWERYLQGLG